MTVQHALRITGRSGCVQDIQWIGSCQFNAICFFAGSFGRGDPVAILGPDGARLGIGLTRYTAEEAGKIKGQRSDRIETLLGYPGRAALVHRDDMAI